MECPKCGAGNPDYAVYCSSCSALIKKPHYWGEWTQKGGRIVINNDWTRFTKLFRTAVKLVLIAVSIVLLLSALVIYMFIGGSGFADYTTLELGLWSGITAFAIALLVLALMMIGYSLVGFGNPLKDSRFRIGFACLVASLLILQYLRP